MLKAEKSQKGIPGRATSSSKDQEGGSPHGAESGTHEKMRDKKGKWVKDPRGFQVSWEGTNVLGTCQAQGEH